jgi:two-component system invasion response regulator UvrY
VRNFDSSPIPASAWGLLMIRVLITDDHPIVRRGLRQIVASEADMDVTEAGNGAEALQLIDTGEFNLVLLDLSMPGISGLEVLNRIRTQHPQLPVLVLSAHPETEFAVRIIKAGASGYLNKHLAPEELVTAIRRVMGGRKYIGPAVAELLADSLGKGGDEAHAALSDREFQVMLLIAAGKTVTEIAEEIVLSVKTVSTYRARILEKMNLKNNAEMMRYVVANKIG